MQADEMKFCSDEEKRETESIIARNYGCKFDLGQFCVFKTERGDKVWLCSKKILELDLGGLHINSLGMYLGKLKGGRINLSIEGSQMVGGRATKNVVIVDDAGARKFIQGFDADAMEKAGCEDGNFVLVKCGGDFFGSGRLSGDRVENMIPKNRRAVFTTGRLI